MKLLVLPVSGWLAGESCPVLRVDSTVFRLCFLRPVHTFSCLKSNSGSDFGHAETGSGAEKRVVLRREFSYSNFKVE